MNALNTIFRAIFMSLIFLALLGLDGLIDNFHGRTQHPAQHAQRAQQ